jgi:hypothetical protein
MNTLPDLNYLYSQSFFELVHIDSTPVAEYLSPIISEALDVKSVVDLGCGTGTWLRGFKKQGAKIYGVEGSLSAKPLLVIPDDCVYFGDLRYPLNIDITEEIDLVISIEVAEHIEPQFVYGYLTNLTDIFKPRHIIMTAAPPGQCGTGHFNCQPKKYWYGKIECYGYERDIYLEEILTAQIWKGRLWNDAPDELKAPPDSNCSDFHPNTKGYKGVWIPFWLPDNLMCFRRTNNL